MKKRLIALCLALCLIFAEASAEKVFAPETAKEGKRQAVQCLLECGFSSEYGGDDKLSRWEEDISIYIGGEATREDIERWIPSLWSFPSGFRFFHLLPGWKRKTTPM